jgi:hypothetical protein
MITKRNALVLALGGPLLVLSLGGALLFGQEFGQDASGRPVPKILPGTWDVTLRFPPETCQAPCSCPGNTPNIPIPTLNTYMLGGSMQVALGSLLAGPGHGSWAGIGRNRFEARFKFLLFNPDGSRRGSEVITKTIRFTGPDTFEAISTFDLFDAAGTMTAQGCRINETATRFE